MMPTFFHGWRRKAGCITLLMACVLPFWWVRSRSLTDVMRLRERNKSLNTIALDYTTLFDSDYVNVFASNDPSLVWLRRRDRYHAEPAFETYPITSDVLERMIPQVDISRHSILHFPYAVIVIPLMLLSAYLILWKPKKKVKRDA